MTAEGRQPGACHTQPVTVPMAEGAGRNQAEEGADRRQAEVVARAAVDLAALGLAPVDRVLDAWATGVRIDRRPAPAGAAGFEGRVDLVVACGGTGADRPLLLVPVEAPFGGRLSGAVEEMELMASVEAVEARPAEPCPGQPGVRRLEACALVRVSSLSLGTGRVAAIPGVLGVPGLRLRTGEVNTLRWLRPRRLTLEVEGGQDLVARGLPPCRRVVGGWGHALITEVRPHLGRLRVSGRVEARVVYSGPGRPLCVAAAGLPFSAALALEGEGPGGTGPAGAVETDCALERVWGRTRDRDGDGECETLTIVAAVAVTARVLEQRAHPVVLYAAGPEGLDIARGRVQSAAVVGGGEARAVARAALEPADPAGPPVRRVLWCRALPSIETLELMEDRLVLLGRVRFWALYENERGGAAAARGEAGCEAVLALAGVGPGMCPRAAVELEGVEWRVDSPRPGERGRLTARAVVRFRALVTAIRAVEVITGVAVRQLRAAPASRRSTPSTGPQTAPASRRSTSPRGPQGAPRASPGGRWL